MDEVLAVGDMKFQKKCLGKMGDAAGNEGKTVLYVSHNMDTIRQLCTRCVVLDKGQIIFDGDVDEAIKMYLDNGRGGFASFYELKDAKRPSVSHGALFYLTSFEFLNKSEPVYYTNEKIIYKICWESKKDIEGLRISFTLKDAVDGKVAGMTESDVFANVKAGDSGESILEFDVSNLVEGQYVFEPDIYVRNEFGNHFSYDHPQQKMCIELIKDPELESLTWQKKFWGNVRLNTMKVRKM